MAEAAPFARVRVARAEMEGGAQPKEMSEKALVEKLERDLAKLEQAAKKGA